MRDDRTNDAGILALQALAAAMADQRLAERFLSLSGIDAPELRQRAGNPRFQAAFLAFLEAYEPDLIAIAEAVGVPPSELVEARRSLEA